MQKSAIERATSQRDSRYQRARSMPFFCTVSGSCAATGTDLPITDVLRLAAKAQMHLSVFDDHTDEPLFLGRAQRLASQAQRFMLFAKYGGCSDQDCPIPFAHSEIHHAEKDWADGGLTDVNHLAPACGPHNRSVGTRPEQWTTEKITHGPDRGRYGWRRNTDPPDQLRTNHLHRVDELLERYRLAALGPWGQADSPSDTTPVDDPWDIDDGRHLPIELGLATRLLENLPRRTHDITWPRHEAA